MRKNNIHNNQGLSSPGLSPGKQRAFRAIIYLLPLLFLLLLETALRLGDYGGNLAVFVPGPGRLNSYYICNRNVARRYFVGAKQVPTPANDYFKKRKPVNGYRVFVLGGSTANGYPYGSNLMFSRILQARLEAALPDKAVEVVNVSMAAINSYSLFDFFDEVLDKEPDAILIYAGHNEYYGALGAASMINFGRNRTFVLGYLKLGRLKTFLAVRDLVFKLKSLAGKNEIAPTATLMERMVAKQSIPLNSVLYHEGVVQFKENMNAMLAKAGKKNIPVVLSDLVSNISGQAPFISLDEPESAASAFQKAVAFKNSDKDDLAKKEFIKAKDLDALRFRAPSEFNAILHNLGAAYDAPVVAMDSVFQVHSPHGLVGDNLMVDHLHPNIKGYFLMADAFFAKMINSGLIPKPDAPLPTNSQLRRTWGYSRLDSLCGVLSIDVLKGGWPFKPHTAPNTALEDFQTKDAVEEMAKRVVKYDNISIIKGHEILAEHFDKAGDRESANKEYAALISLKAYSAKPYLKVSEMLVKSQNAERVPELIETSLLFHEYPISYILLGEARIEMAQYYDAIAAFKQAQQLGASKTDPHVLLGLLHAYAETKQIEKAKEIQKLLGEALPQKSENNGASNVNELLQTSKKLITDKKYEQAQAELQRSLAIHETSLAHMLLGQILLQERQVEEAIQHLERARQMAPNKPLLLYNLCIALVQHREYARAWNVLKEIEGIAPDFGDPYDLKTKLAGLLNKQQK